jgi:hypothetical protein
MCFWVSQDLRFFMFGFLATTCVQPVFLGAGLDSLLVVVLGSVSHIKAVPFSVVSRCAAQVPHGLGFPLAFGPDLSCSSFST